MTAKDKAIEIAHQYIDLSDIGTSKAVQCAIIHVKGIIEVTRSDPYPRKKTQMDKEYWQKVLTELEKM